jgi:hypothetical protein
VKIAILKKRGEQIKRSSFKFKIVNYFLCKKNKKKINMQCMKIIYIALGLKKRKLIIKLKICDHSLLIKNGKHLEVHSEEHVCSKCKVIDDEQVVHDTL